MKSIVAAFALAAACVSGSTLDHRYKDGEHVELWVNKVGHIITVREDDGM